MANAGVFEAGYEQGFERGGEKRALDVQRKEQEFLQRNTDLLNRRDALVHKLSTLKDANGNPLPGYDEALNDLQGTIHEIGQHWHPDKNPGMIQKFGHMLTDRFGITNPQDRIKKEAARRDAQSVSDEKEAQSLAASGPLSPAQTSAQETQAQLAAKKAVMDFTIQWAKDHGVEGADLDELTRHMAGLTNSKLIPDGKPYKGEDGKYYQPMRDPDSNQISNIPMPPDYTPPVTPAHPSTSKLGQYEAAYRHDHNIAEDEPLSINDLNYIQQQAALSSGAPSSTVTTTLKQDINGWWVPVTETNRRIPGIGTLLPDPRGSVVNPGGLKESGSENPESSSKTPSSSSSPKAPAKKSSPKPGGTTSGPTHVGKPVLQGRTPEYTKAVEDYTATSKIATLADNLQKQAQATPNNMSEADAQFVLTLIRSEAGRVNQQEIAQLFNAGGISEMPDRWAAKTGHGQLSENLRNQLVQFTHSLRDASLASLNALKQQESETGVTTPSSSTPPPNATHTIVWTDPSTGQKHTYYVDDQGNNLGEKK